MKLLIWTLFVVSVDAIFHRLSMQKYTSILPEDSLFGYSISYLPQSKSLIVGAPKADDVGQVFYIDLDSNKTLELKSHLKNEIPQNIVTGFWFGATVRASNNFLVMCAPRYTKDLKVKTQSRYLTSAVCFFAIDKDRMEKLKKDEFKEPKFENRMDTLGFSVDIPVNQEAFEVLLGGPGMFTGRAAIYKSQHANLTTILPTLIKCPRTKDMTYNYGYSVASGRFFADKTQYAISTTFGYNGLGMVYFFNSKQMHIATIEDASKVGSMFGAALCVVYLGEARASILVGAPTFADRHRHDLGAVYLYRPSSKGNEMIRVGMLNGTDGGGYFGYAIASLGDMDGDNREEVAIGAPYENDGRGCVYIYTGAGLIHQKGPLQVIRAKDIWNFGFSLTTLEDYDENGCNELGVGAPRANTVAVLRCMAAVTVNVTAIPPDLNNLKNKTHIEFESCLEITYPQKPHVIVGDIVVTVETPSSAYTIDGVNNGAQTYVVSLKDKPRRNCTKIRVSLSNNAPAEEQPLVYIITARLKDNPEELEEFHPSRVVISDRSEWWHYGLTIISVCGERRCRPVLKTQLSKLILAPYLIGSSEMEYVSLNITNVGEPAYSACVSFKLSHARLREIPDDCTMEGSDVELIICKRNRPLLSEETWITNISIDTNELTSANDKIIITHETYNNCDDRTNKNTTEYEIALKSDVDSITLTGQSEDIISFTDRDVSQVPPLERGVYHDYIISNDGVTNWVDVKCKIQLEDVKYVKYTDREPIEVSVNFETRTYCMPTASQMEKWLTYECNIGDLGRTQKAKVRISATLLPGYIGLTETSNKTISSRLELILKNKEQSLSLSTTLTLHTAKIPTWVYIVALCFGFLALIILGFVLYECGFFKRKNKNKLEQLKTNIRRQTIIRNSMRNTLHKEIAEDPKTLVQHQDEDGSVSRERKDV